MVFAEVDEMIQMQICSGGVANSEVREWWSAAAMVMVGEEEN